MAENPFGSSTEVAVTAKTGLVSVEQQRAIAEVQARMIMARANPRDPMRAMDQILQDCTRLSLAEGALYQYARGGTDIEGPSIKLAESIARRWGNIHAGIRELDRRDGFSECSAFCWDLETGYFEERQFRVRHWRDTKKGGYRVTDERDIYELIANQAQRRKRAVVLSVIPGDVVEAAVQQCEETLNTKADTSPEAIRKMVDAFAALGVTKEQIETRCQRRLESIRPAQLVALRRIYASLKDEMSSVADWFGAVQPTDVAAAADVRGNQALRSRLNPADSAFTQRPQAEVAPPPPVAAEAPRRGRGRRKPAEPVAAEPELDAAPIDDPPDYDEPTGEITAEPFDELPDWDEQTGFDENSGDDEPSGSGELPPESVYVPFDEAHGDIQEWSGRARQRVHEMTRALASPDLFTAFRRANSPRLETLKGEYYAYWKHIDALLREGERRPHPTTPDLPPERVAPG
jgi:hypothetical protein